MKEKKNPLPFVFFFFFFSFSQNKRKKEKKIARARETPAQRGSYFPVARTIILPAPRFHSVYGGKIGGLSFGAPPSRPSQLPAALPFLAAPVCAKHGKRRGAGQVAIIATTDWIEKTSWSFFLANFLATLISLPRPQVRRRSGHLCHYFRISQKSPKMRIFAKPGGQRALNLELCACFFSHPYFLKFACRFFQICRK